jgi:hypothetical protein
MELRNPDTHSRGTIAAEKRAVGHRVLCPEFFVLSIGAGCELVRRLQRCA